MSRRELQSVLLHHLLGDDTHYDWMFEDPDGAPGETRLLTWRIDIPSDQWADAEVGLVELPPHRRAYLEYEGPVSGDRGRVIRVDRGSVVVESRETDSLELFVSMGGFRGRVLLHRETQESWCATFKSQD